MYTLYIGNKNYSSWSLRPWMLLKELQIPFDERLVPFDNLSSYETFRSFSPTGLVPCLIDGDETIWESLAIVEYLSEAHPPVWPYNKSARAWARAAAAEMHAGFAHLRQDCPMTVSLRIRLHSISPGLQKDLDRILELWQEGLNRFNGPYLAGNRFTAVDAYFAPVVFRLQTYCFQLPEFAQNYVDRMLCSRAMQTWAQAAQEEPFREPAHEKEIKALGEWLEDRRS